MRLDWQELLVKLERECLAASRAGEPANPGASEPAGEVSPESPSGFLGGAALADALGIHATQRDAFSQMLMRKRVGLGDDAWREVRDVRPNSPRFLYRADSPALRELAARYKTPKPV